MSWYSFANFSDWMPAPRKQARDKTSVVSPPALKPMSVKVNRKKQDLQLFVTLSPSMPHFPRFAVEDRLAGIRINSAQMFTNEMDNEIAKASAVKNPIPLWFDIKGKQLRIDQVFDCDDHLEITINHPISVHLPATVWFKSEKDHATLIAIKDNGSRLIFDGGPQFLVKEGESFHILDKSLVVGGVTFTRKEKEKIAKVRKAGFTHYCQSYVQCQRDVDEMRELIGKDSKLVLKIEDEKGLKYAATEFKPTTGVHLMAARGDLYVEISPPHRILDALKTVIKADPGAWVGSRFLLSICRPIVHGDTVEVENGQVCYEAVPDCADLCEMAWLHDIGYRRFLLCDELCMREDWLSRCVNILDAFRTSYTKGI